MEKWAVKGGQIWERKRRRTAERETAEGRAGVRADDGAPVTWAP